MQRIKRTLALTLGAVTLLGVLCDGAHPHEPEAGGTQVTQESLATLQFDPVPAWALVDEVTPLRLRGAQPGQTVTIRLRSIDGRGRTWESHAEFRAIATDASTSRPTPLSPVRTRALTLPGCSGPGYQRTLPPRLHQQV